MASSSMPPALTRSNHGVEEAPNAEAMATPAAGNDSRDPEKSEAILATRPTTARSPSGKGDDALNILSDKIRHVTPEENKRVLRKIDRHVMPVLFIIYFLQFMDKQILALTVGLWYRPRRPPRGQAVFPNRLDCTPLSAYLLVRFDVSIYIPILVICWGATLACMAAAQNFVGLLVSRFFLGGFETSTQAAFILIGQMFYKRQEQGLRLTIWFSNVGWVNIVGSLIMYAFGHITKGPLRHYQIVFILLGTLTTVCGVASFFVFPTNPVKSKFLTAEEKIIAVERLRANQQGVETKIFKFKQVLETLLDLKSWYDTMLFLVPYGALQIIAMALVLLGSQPRQQYKSPLSSSPVTPFSSKISITILSTQLFSIPQEGTRSTKPALLVAYYLLACSSAVTPALLGWQAINTAGHTKKSSTTAMTIMGSSALSSSSPKTGRTITPASSPASSATAAQAAIAILTATYLFHLNKKNEMLLIIDYSMTNPDQVEEKDGQRHTIGRNAFEGLD
ncbi:allantoate permease [Ephemerocybe angulata]|uniref:Allantoate permease n=1 Tax=Ephemerocybe angulata TaxID=980116 RepID=A0A8H6I3P2_9AGAR|nr:allantoate permease [Tulosesus angulatus]